MKPFIVIEPGGESTLCYVARWERGKVISLKCAKTHEMILCAHSNSIGFKEYEKALIDIENGDSQEFDGAKIISRITKLCINTGKGATPLEYLEVICDSIK